MVGTPTTAVCRQARPLAGQEGAQHAWNIDTKIERDIDLEHCHAIESEVGTLTTAATDAGTPGFSLGKNEDNFEIYLYIWTETSFQSPRTSSL